MTAREKVFGGVLGAIWLSGFAAVWQVAAPQFSDENKARIFLGYLALGIGLLLWWIRETRGRRMGLIEFLLWGGGLGLIAGLIVYVMFAIAERAPAVASVAQADQANAATIPAMQEPAGKDELEFYFHPFLIAGGQHNIQYSGATMTNRSARRMHLALWAHMYYWKDNGQPVSLGFQPEWNPDGLKEGTGQTTIDLDAFETKEGSLILFLDKPEKNGIRQWNINPFKNVYIHAFDSVTGKHIAFKASPGYPDAKMPWPLPAPAKLLALEFPGVPKSDLATLDTLDLLVRTQFFGYQNDGRLSFKASLTNLSSSRMKLQINLLTRKSVDDKEWWTFRGVLTPSRAKNKNHLDYYALDFGPGDVADCSLVFANTGFKNTKGDELKESPSVSLFEIFDEVSRKKVWCAIEPGYPPLADMRSAAIQPAPPIPKPDSDNLQKDESNDSK